MLLVNGNENYRFKADNKNVNFATRLYLGSISKNVEIAYLMLNQKYL